MGDSNYSLFVICALRVWQFGSAMVIFLAALKGVQETYMKQRQLMVQLNSASSLKSPFH